MAEEKKKEVKVKKKETYFPIISMLYGLVVVVIVILEYLGVVSLSREIIILSLFIAGILLFWRGIVTGLEHKRKSLLKKYI